MVEEFEEEFEEVEEFEEELSFTIRGDTPQDSPPAIVLTVAYDGKLRKPFVKLYDPVNDKIYFWYDNSGHRPYLIVDVSPEDLIRKYPKVISHRGFSHVEVVRKYDPLSGNEVLMTRIYAKDPLSIGGRADSIRELFKKSWESRIKYHMSYLYDKGIVPGMYYKIEGGNLVQVPVEVAREVMEFIEGVYHDDPEYLEVAREWLPLFQAPIPSIKRLAVDIEVFTPGENRVPNPRDAIYEVLSIGLAGSDGLKRVLLLRRGDRVVRIEDMERIVYDDVELVFFDSEYEMLREFFKIMLQYPIIITFNGDNFDLPYIYHRALRLGFKKEEIPIILKRDGATVALGIHIDLYKFFSARAIEIYAFGGKYRGGERSLDAIAQALVRMPKLPRDKLVSDMDYVELANYNFRDALLTLYLTTFENDLVLRLMVLLSRISKTPLDDLTRSQVSAWIRNMFYYEHRRRGWLIPEQEDILASRGEAATKAIIKGKKYAGAIVLDPIPGIYPNVYVIDFASMYPSVIKKWNLSYETVRCQGGGKIIKPIPDSPHWVCGDRRGIVALLIGLLRDMRAYVYKPLSKKSTNPSLRSYYNVIQSALKVFINASYGVLGADIFPLYCPPAAELTTALGRYILSRTALKAMELGLVPIYGDTDSLFIWNPDEEKLEELVRWVEEEMGIEIELDKVYRIVAMSGRKKNYVGIQRDGSIDIKGLVGKKRNTPDFAKEAFNEVLKIISKINTLEDVDEVINAVKERVRDYYRRLQRREIPLNLLAIRTAMTKPLDAYKKNTPQHVKAALQLRNMGIKVDAGDLVSYVKTTTKEGVKPVQLARIDEVDPSKYVEYLSTSLEQLLDAFGIQFEGIMGSSLI